jgi:hypothetical protein
MSRQNKVNPGTYTQRGRLTQDDAARELQKQNALGSPQTWQPVKKNAMPGQGGGRGTDSAADETAPEETSPTVETRQASRVTKKKTRNVGGAGPKSRRTASHRTS